LVRPPGALDLTATGGKIVDSGGGPVNSLPNGGKFWVTSETAGNVTIDATGSGQVPTGRVFTALDGPNTHQKLILAAVAGAPLSAKASATVTAKPPGLPVTGASLTGAVVAGLMPTLGGVLLVTTIRRRRIRFTA
jgi:hypothetical protein